MKTKGIILREWDLSDAPAVAEYANNPKIASQLRDGFPHPYSIRDANNFIQSAIMKDTSARLFAIDLNGEAIGSIGAIFKEDIYRLNVEIGYWLAEQHWGKGIATTAIRLITTWIFDNNSDIERVYAEPFADNAGSRRVLEKAGYVHEATFKRNVIKNGLIKDSMIYSLLRSVYQENQP